MWNWKRIYISLFKQNFWYSGINECFQVLFKGKENTYKLISEECLEFLTPSSKILNESKRIYLVKIDSLKSDSLNCNKLLHETFDKDDEIKKKNKETKNKKIIELEYKIILW